MKHITAALLSLVFLVAACVQPPANFEASFGSSQCATGEGGADVIVSGNDVTFSGNVITSTPCYDRKITGEQSGNEITIKIETKPQNAICIQCVGSQPFEGSFTLENGTYNVRFLVNGEIFKEQKITIG